MTNDDLLRVQILLPGQPGRLDERRVRVLYPDGCQTAFPAGREPTIGEIVAHHQRLHRLISRSTT